MQLSFIRNLFIKVHNFNTEFPLYQRNFSVWKACTNGHNFSLPVMLLNKHYINLYTASYDVLCWSVATRFNSTLVYNYVCVCVYIYIYIYIQSVSRL
jgi:hypothetical protein